MQCPSCGKTGFVTISNKRYCSNCGAKLASQTRAMSDIKPTAKSTPNPTAAPRATAPPATQLHGQQVGSGPLLDLRSSPEASAPTPVPETAAKAAAPPTPAPAKVQAPIKTTPPAAAPPPHIRLEQASRLKQASAIPKSKMVQKFTGRQDNIAKTPILPNAVATKVEAMPSLIEPEPSKPKSPILEAALAAARPSSALTPAKASAAIIAVVIMGGLIWFQNSPKLAFRTAAAKAGFDASLPTYIPSSYHQNGPVSASSGQLSISFTTPSSNELLNISQHKTDWDSNSLRENYVSHQANSFLAVQGQGLTIYLLSDQATWVNHGVWYKVAGISKLNREQILKIAYGL